jgi:predicted nucleic acid-binding protein
VTGWLLDTNVLSELRRPRPASKVTKFVGARGLDNLFVSVVTLAELRYGIARIEDVARRTELEDWLAIKIRPLFEGRVLPVSEDVMVRWRLLVESGRKQRHTFSQPDLLIAATALVYGLTVATRDTTDFVRAGAPVLNPWLEDFDP